MRVLASYRRVLGNRHLARLLFGEFVSSVGDWLYLVALLIVIYERAGDPVVLGIVGAARVLPYIILSVPAGIAADRFDRRLILLVTDLARGVVMLLMAATVLVGGPVEAIVALSIVATCFSAFFSPAIGSYIPGIVRDESELGPANSAWSMLDNLAFIVGPAVAGLLIGIAGLAPAFLLNAASFAIVAAVLWRLPPSRAVPVAAGEGGEDAVARPPSVRAVLRPVLAPLAGLNVLGIVGSFVGGGLGVLTVVIAVDVLRSGDTGTGLLNAAVGAGGFLGGLTSGVLVLRRRLAPPLLIGGAVLAASLALLGNAASLPLAMLAMGAGAAGSLLLEVVGTTLLQRVVPDVVRGRTIGAMETLAVTAYAAGAFALPVLASLFGLAATLVVAGVLVAVSVAVAVPLLGRHAVQEPAEDAVRERLLHVPILAGLPVARLEAAMARTAVVRVEPGGGIVRQGDPADRFYVIVDGLVQVTQTSAEGIELTLRRMGRDEVFGEIGLLTHGPRTATVTAIESTTLLALEGPDFLELVGSGPGLTPRLLDLHRGATPVAAVGG